MDVVHHAFIGGAGALTAAAFGHETAGFSFLAASVFPDLDVLFMLFGKRFYLRHHQSITHSLLLAPVYAALIGLGLARSLYVPLDWALFSGALAGLALHILLDWANTFRISLFLPATFKRYSLDAVFFIDSVSWGLTGLFYLLYGCLRIEMTLYLYPLLFFAYLTAKFFLHRHVVAKLNPHDAIPSSLNPFEFYILEKIGDNYVSYLFNAFGKRVGKKKHYPSVPDTYADMASRSPVFRDMKHVLRQLHITDVLSNASGTTLNAADIAVRNFGGRFGKTKLEFDPEGGLLHEVANI